MTEEQRAELPTNDPTNPAHRLARDLADGEFQNEEVAADIAWALATIARLEAEKVLSIQWHEERDKALSKQPPSSDGGWRRMEHQEEIDRLSSRAKDQSQ